MKTIGDHCPDFKMQAVVSSNVDTAFKEISLDNYKGQWLVLFFWPKDFTFVCPTEIAEFGRLNGDFEMRDAKVLGVSTDSEFVHLAWRQSKEELKDLPFPMGADITRQLSESLGILNHEEGVANRATFIIDPQGIIRFVMVTDLNVGRNPSEVIRVLDGLQSDELCPCNWKKGEDTLDLQNPIA
jgi:peroxiredoxin (alkyl hydroperoxide reductase subunit C)